MRKEVGYNTNDSILNYSIPDIWTWKYDAIQTSIGITFAPFNLYTIDHNYHTIEYFTWYEAIRLEKDVLIPNGWRIPSLSEWRKIVDSFNINYLDTTLGLKCNGYIMSESMYAYREHPDDAILVKGEKRYGLYWSSTSADSFCAYELLLNDGIANTYATNANKTCGYSIRCIAI